MLSRSLRAVSCSLNASKTIIPSFLNVIHQTKSNNFSSSIISNNSSTPWYLDPQESPNISSPLKTIQIPELPDNYPQSLENLVVYLAQELGIDDLAVFDMRNNLNTTSDNEGAYDISDFMIIGTGKSPKHLQKASSELDFFIKHNLHKLPSTEGILKSGALAKYHRRLQRKGKKAPNYSKYDYGASPNTWVMTDTKTDGIIIHMLTKERRNDLNLEYLWSNDSEKVKYSKTRSNKESDDIFSGIRYFHTTSVRAADFNKFDLSFENYADKFQCLLRCHLVDSKDVSLTDLKDHINLMYSSGLVLDYNMFKSYIQTILQSDEFHQDVNSNIEMFKKRENFVANLLKTYNLELSTEEILDLVSILIISNSGFNNDSFLTLKQIIKTFNIQHEKIHDYSRIVNKFNLLSERITNTLNIEHRQLKRNIDSLLLTVFANKLNWAHFFQTLDSAIKRNDVSVIQASLPLVAVCADSLTASEFEQKYLPLIIESGFPEGMERFADLLYDKTHTD